MALVIYILCLLTSVLCTYILVTGYFKKRVRLLLWCALCFAGLALNNILLVIDFLVGPTVDLSLYRIIPAVIGFGILIFGYTWDGL